MQEIDTKYIDQFLRLKSISDILERKFFKNTREITESMAIYSACRDALPKKSDVSDTSFKLVEITNSSTQRTAGLFVFLTRWECYGVGKRLGGKFFNAARLHTISGNAESYSFESSSTVVFVAIDPQFELSSVLDSVSAPHVIVITLSTEEVAQGFVGHTPMFERRDTAVIGDRQWIRAYSFKSSGGWKPYVEGG